MQIIWSFSLLLKAITFCLGFTILVCITLTIDGIDEFYLLKDLTTYTTITISILSLSLVLLISNLIENLARPLVDYDRFKTATLQRIAELESKANPNKQ